MLSTGRQVIFQKEWTGEGERGFRDYLLIPAIFFGAVSPGLYISSLIFGFIPGYWIALIMNLIGYGLTHLLFLGRMERFWRAMINWKTSWLSRGFLFNVFFMGFGFLYALSVSTGFPVLSSPAVRMLLFLLSGVSAVLFAAYPGFMLSIVKAIPFWRSVLEPVIFFLQGLMGGVAIHMITMRYSPSGMAVLDSLIKLDILLVLSVLMLFMSALIVKAMHGGAEKSSVEFLLRGRFSRVFLGGAMVIGLVIPLVVLLLGIMMPLDFGRYRVIYYLVMFMELAGIYLGKYSILRAGTYTPLYNK